MNRPLAAAALSALAFAVGCQPPAIQGTPFVSAAEIQQVHAVRSRVLPESPEAAFSRTLGVLLDHGYLIRGSDKAAGLIAFHQDWNQAIVGAWASLDGTLLFEPAEDGGTRVRALLAGKWQNSGEDLSAHVEDQAYAQLFDLLKPAPAAK